MPETADPAPLAWLSLALLLATVGLFTLSALLERSGPIRLRHFAQEAGGALRALYDARRRFEAFRFLLSSMAKVAPAALGLAVLLLLISAGWSPGFATLTAVAGVALVAGGCELVNRALVGRNPEGALRRLTRAYRATYVLLRPVVALAAVLLPAGSLERTMAEEEEDEASDEEIEAYIAVGTQEGILEPDEVDLLRGIVDFGDTQVRSVMTPRIDMVCAPVDSPLEDLSRVVVESGHSRIPVYKESIDHIVGILHIRDLMGGLSSNPQPKAGAIAKPAYFVPLTKPLDELLRQLQARHQQVAIVVDEYGGTAGLVTMEDLIEEIVGDIADEHDEIPQEVQRLPDGSWRMDGRTHLEELGEIVAIEFEDTPYETVGGLVLSELGDVPEFGEVVVAHGLRLTVEKVLERRIQTVRVELLVPVEEGGGETE